MITSRTLSRRPIRRQLSHILRSLLDSWYQRRQGDCLKAGTSHGGSLKQCVNEARANRNALGSGVTQVQDNVEKPEDKAWCIHGEYS